MREILFRAKRIGWRDMAAKDCWVEGFPFKQFLDGEERWCVGTEPLSANDYSGIVGCNRFWYEIDHETVCQCTGLTDKNGKRIWENDVISINTYDYNEPAEDYFGKVVYVDAWGCWCIKQPGEEKPIPLCECEGSYLTERVVEGNIFDNPELLEED